MVNLHLHLHLHLYLHLHLHLHPSACIQAALSKGGAEAANKSARNKLKERAAEIGESAGPEKEYKVQFHFPAAARRLNPPLISMKVASEKYRIRACVAS